MNLNERVALILGLAIIRAEEMQIRAEQAEKRAAELEAEMSEESDDD